MDDRRQKNSCCDCDCHGSCSLRSSDKMIGLIFLHLCRENIPKEYAFYYPHFQDLCRKSKNCPESVEITPPESVERWTTEESPLPRPPESVDHDDTNLVVGENTQSSVTQHSPQTKDGIATEFDFEQFCSSNDDHIREWISEHHQESESDFQPMLGGISSLAILMESIFCGGCSTKDEKDEDDENIKMQFRQRVQNCNTVVDIQLVKHPNWSLRDTPGRPQGILPSGAAPQLGCFVRFILENCFDIFQPRTTGPNTTPRKRKHEA